LATRPFGGKLVGGVKFYLVLLVFPAAVVLAIAAVETRIVHAPPANGATRGIVWDGHTFATRAEFARWLRSQGTSYRVWARRHPTPPFSFGRRPL